MGWRNDRIDWAVTDLEAAWNALHDAKPDHWYVGRRSYNEQGEVLEMYAYDGRERANGPLFVAQPAGLRCGPIM
jgi:hypothetical protein